MLSHANENQCLLLRIGYGSSNPDAPAQVPDPPDLSQSTGGTEYMEAAGGPKEQLPEYQ